MRDVHEDLFIFIPGPAGCAVVYSLINKCLQSVAHWQDIHQETHDATEPLLIRLHDLALHKCLDVLTALDVQASCDKPVYLIPRPQELTQGLGLREPLLEADKVIRHLV